MCGHHCFFCGTKPFKGLPLCYRSNWISILSQFQSSDIRTSKGKWLSKSNKLRIVFNENACLKPLFDFEDIGNFGRISNFSFLSLFCYNYYFILWRHEGCSVSYLHNVVRMFIIIIYVFNVLWSKQKFCFFLSWIIYVCLSLVHLTFTTAKLVQHVSVHSGLNWNLTVLVSVVRARKTAKLREKPLRARRELCNNKYYPHNIIMLWGGIEPKPHWQEVSALTTAPPGSPTRLCFEWPSAPASVTS